MESQWVYFVFKSIGRSLRKIEGVERKVESSTQPKYDEETLSFLEERDDKGVSHFYEYFTFYQLKWVVNEINNEGTINILPLDKVFINYENFVYFDHTPEDSPLRDFKIIDFFVDEACVGIYVDREDLPGMHFFEFENEAYPLHVDFEGYLKLLGHSRGYLYWQKVILDHLRNQETPITKEFKENMPKLFVDFDFEAFIQLYEEVRIDK